MHQPTMVGPMLHGEAAQQRNSAKGWRKLVAKSVEFELKLLASHGRNPEIFLLNDASKRSFAFIGT